MPNYSNQHAALALLSLQNQSNPAGQHFLKVLVFMSIYFTMHVVNGVATRHSPTQGWLLGKIPRTLIILLICFY